LSNNNSIKTVREIIDEVKKAVIGKDKIIIKILLAILAKGHILIEDIPGVGKTTVALSFSKSLSLDYNRVQFTPDVLPTDITGFTVYNKHSGSFEFKPGASMCNLLLADEINRTSSKTQSALLEIMEEGRVTVDGTTHALPKPFIVMATQNPIGSVGTQELPEATIACHRLYSCVFTGAAADLFSLRPWAHNAAHSRGSAGAHSGGFAFSSQGQRGHCFLIPHRAVSADLPHLSSGKAKPAAEFSGEPAHCRWLGTVFMAVLRLGEAIPWVFQSLWQRCNGGDDHAVAVLLSGDRTSGGAAQ